MIGFQKKFDTIKRRDGTPYTSECRRAIQASLSNNPSTRPFFKKETKKGVVLWSLAKRSIEFLAEQKKGAIDDPNTTNGEIVKMDESSDSSNPEQKENDNDEEIVDNNEEEEMMEEEIHDEEEFEEDIEKDEKDVKPEDRIAKKQQRDEPKEDKHLLANRVKRARKIKENAGKRLQNNTEHENNKMDTRLKKRRR